jgi:hypothetical protein
MWWRPAPLERVDANWLSAFALAGGPTRPARPLVPAHIDRTTRRWRARRRRTESTAANCASRPLSAQTAARTRSEYAPILRRR